MAMPVLWVGITSMDKVEDGRQRTKANIIRKMLVPSNKDADLHDTTANRRRDLMASHQLTPGRLLGASSLGNQYCSSSCSERGGERGVLAVIFFSCK
jgi:hypothetical protein